YRICTLAGTHGSGLGSDLLEACISDAAAYLWVLKANPRAQAFYAKHGFRPDGARKRLPAAFNELPEIRMARPAGFAPRASQQSSCPLPTTGTSPGGSTVIFRDLTRLTLSEIRDNE
ncbi:MAG: GNAT family N-acetyltransferase, partial [Micrococcaceae bacterium]|nr:GNAT family N-acetyltransferase [Micrococcaceae bacterium]